MKAAVRLIRVSVVLVVFAALGARRSIAGAFEGRIDVTLKHGGQVETVLYTVGTNQIRIERGETNWPYARNIVSRDTGATTILFPHNRSFVRLKNPGDSNPTSASPPGIPVPPRSPDESSAPGAPPSAGPAIGPHDLPGMPPPPPAPRTPQMPPGVGPQAGSGPGAMPMPAMPMASMSMERAELKSTNQTTNLLGYVCARYELRQRGQVMEIWATDQLLPFQPWLQNQPRHFGPRLIEEQWGELLNAKKLFPLLAILKFENGPERLRFEVKSVTPAKIGKEEAERLFQPPSNYQEIEPLPF